MNRGWASTSHMQMAGHGLAVLCSELEQDISAAEGGALDRLN